MATKINERDDKAVAKVRSKTRPAASRANATRKTPTAAAARDYTAPSSAASVRGDQAQRDRHDQRKGWFLAEASKQAFNRTRMARCESMYDSEQWDYQEAQDVEARGQNPVVYNEIKPTIDWLIGMERRVRVDFTVMAEDDGEEADEDAGVKTKLLKYLDDTNMAQFERSWAAEDAFKAGVGWLEVGLRGAQGKVPVYVGAVSWRDILWDSNSRKRDLSDARYMFRIKVVDLDVAEAIFPDKKEELARCVQTGDNLTVFSEWLGGMGLITGLDNFNGIDDPLEYSTAKPVDMFNTRKRVLLLECWSREPVRQRADDSDSLNDPVSYRIRVSIMTESDTLVEDWSPFKHDRFPFVPVWAYINRRTGLPYSPIWPLIGPQVSLNHRMSKSLFEASSNQMKVEKGAVDNETMTLEEIQAELNDPSGIAVFANGALSGNKVQERPNAGAAQVQLVLAEQDRMTIRSMSGVTGENRGENTSAKSGKAILAKQAQGSMLTAELFDNLLLARKIEGDLTLSVAEQFIVQPMSIRVAGDGMKPERVRINEPAPGGYLNDITARRAQFVVGEQAWKQAYAEAAFESLLEVMTQLATAAPQAVINVLDLVFDMHPNLPKKRALVARLRSINGQSDPDGKLTPEQQAEQEQKAAIAKAQFQAQMAQLVADIREAQAKGEKLEAEAMNTRLTSIYEAAQAAQVLAAMPAAAPIADELLKSAGYRDMSGDSQIIDTPPAPVQPAQPAAQPGQPLPELLQSDGAQAGIETPAADGVIPQGVN